MNSRSSPSETSDTGIPFHLEIIQKNEVSLFVLTPMVALTCTAPPDGDPVLTMNYPGGDPIVIHKGEDAGNFYEWILRAKILGKSFVRIDTRHAKVTFWSQSQIVQKKGILDTSDDHTPPDPPLSHPPADDTDPH